MSIFLLNRDPEPNETNVPSTSDIFLEIVDNTGADIDASETRIWVNGVFAFDAGTFQPMFDGASAAATAPAVGVYRVRIDPTFSFDSEQELTVLVESRNDAASPDTLSTSYSFTAEDRTAPALASVVANSATTVRVTFDESITASDATATNDALNPANYAFTRQTAPAVTVEATSVEAITTLEVEVTIDIPMTASASYQLRVTNVEDLFGNETLAPFNVMSFTGFQPAVPEDRSFELYDMLARMNQKEDLTEDLKKFSSCFQEVVELLLADIDAFADILDPDTAPLQYVEAMLEDLGNPFSFAASLAEVDKRRLLRVLVDIYKQKGTAPGIINVIRFFTGVEIAFDVHAATGLILGVSELGVDWELATDDQALLYSFSVVSPVALTDAQREQITEIVEYMKPAHTHLLGIEEPTTPTVIDHLELGLSELGGEEWQLH